MLAVGRMPTAIAHDPRTLLALDVAVDTRHPRRDLVHQLAFAERQDVIGPFGDAVCGGLDPRQAALGCEADHPRHPLDAVFGGPGIIAKAGMRAHRHEEVGKALNEDAEISLWPVCPDILEPHAVCTANVDPVEGAGDSVEPGRINDDVEFVVAVAGLNAGCGDALNRRLVDIDELDVGLVVDFVIPGFEGYAAGAEAVVFRDQLLRRNRVLDALADFLGDKLGGQAVRFTVGQRVAELPHPNAETRRIVKLFPEGLAFLGGYFEGLTRVRGVDIAARGGAAEGEYLVVARPDVRHLLFGNLPVVQRRAPVRGTLEHG